MVDLHILPEGSISSVHPCSYRSDDHRILVNATSFVASSRIFVVEPSVEKHRELSYLPCLDQFGLSNSQVSEIWSPGAHGDSIHSWIIKPSYFKPEETYPLAFFIHGGPFFAWTDSWGTRWNPLVYAEQGYIVAMPNFHGMILLRTK